MYLWGGCGLTPYNQGDFVKKQMHECNGEELLTEVCNHFGFTRELPHILETSTCIPQVMPYEMAHFLPRKRSDRPRVVPDGSTNLAFMGQYTESEECVMLVESSVRCGMMAVYSLLGTGAVRGRRCRRCTPACTARPCGGGCCAPSSSSPACLCEELATKQSSYVQGDCFASLAMTRQLRSQ